MHESRNETVDGAARHQANYSSKWSLCLCYSWPPTAAAGSNVVFLRLSIHVCAFLWCLGLLVSVASSFTLFLGSGAVFLVCTMVSATSPAGDHNS